MATTRVSDITALTLLGIDEIFNKAAKRIRELEYKNCVREKTISKQIGVYQTLGSLGAAEKKSEENPITFHKIITDHQTSIYNYTYSNGVKCTLEAEEYDQYDVVRATFGDQLVDTMVDLKETVVAAVYNGVFTDTAADGVYNASATHPLCNDSTKYNDNLASGALSTDNIKAAKNHFNWIYNNAGRFFPTKATHLLIHPNKLFTVTELLESSLLALELSNTKNSLQSVMPVKVITNRYLTYNTSTDVSPWHMLDKTLEAGCVLQIKKGLTLKTWWDYDNLTYKGVAYEMYGAGMVAPGFGIVSSPGS